MFIDNNPGRGGEWVLLIVATPLSFLGIPVDLGLTGLEEGWIILSATFFCGTVPFPFDGIIIPGRKGEMAFEVIAEAMEDGMSVGEDELNGV